MIIQTQCLSRPVRIHGDTRKQSRAYKFRAEVSVPLLASCRLDCRNLSSQQPWHLMAPASQTQIQKLHKPPRSHERVT